MQSHKPSSLTDLFLKVMERTRTVNLGIFRWCQNHLFQPLQVLFRNIEEIQCFPVLNRFGESEAISSGFINKVRYLAGTS